MLKRTLSITLTSLPPSINEHTSLLSYHIEVPILNLQWQGLTSCEHKIAKQTLKLIIGHAYRLQGHVLSAHVHNSVILGKDHQHTR